VSEVNNRKWAVAAAVRVGVLMLSAGAQVRQVETSLRQMLEGLGVVDAQVIVGFGTVSVSHVDTAGGAPVTAVGAVSVWGQRFDQLAAAGRLINRIADDGLTPDVTDRDIDRLEQLRAPYPGWLAFAAPALLSAFVTILFRGSVGDAAVTMAIGLAIQPLLARIAGTAMSQFFQVTVGVTLSVLVVVLLVKAGLPINGGLVLTGSLLRFLPGGALVSGMHDLIAGSVLPGVANLAQVALLGAAIAGSASLILQVGRNLDVDLTITTTGATAWPMIIVVLAGAAAVTMAAIRATVPPPQLATIAMLGGSVTLIAQGFTPAFEQVTANTRTLLAALLVGAVGAALASRMRAPSNVWTVPAILPLLPAPATLLPLLADSDAVQQSLQGQALETSFAIGVGVAIGAIVLTAAVDTRRTWTRRIIARTPKQ
jgi:uncharacterized membrane protein YjjP (DUF1212 family)/uncharacterized membrane protein YjjB (DUF3815 family)